MAHTHPPPPHTTHDLTSAYLYLLTATTAITNLKAQINSTTEAMYNEHLTGYATAHGEELLEHENELEMWEGRLVEAGMGLVHWLAVRSLGRGRGLPVEILQMVGRELVWGEGVLEGVW